MRSVFKWFCLCLCIFSCVSCSILRRSVVNVKSKGAFADGVHDDWLTIQSLLDKGGTIYFPAGRYIISNSLHVTKSNTHLRLHKDAIIECYSTTYTLPGYGNGGATIVFNHPDYIYEQGEQICDVGIEGGHVRNMSPTDSNHPNNENAVAFTHCRDFYCRNVVIDFCNRKGITAQYYNSNGLIEGCEIYDCGLHAITLESNSNDISIVNNVIILRDEKWAKGKNSGNGQHYCIHLYNSDGIIIKDNTVSNRSFKREPEKNNELCCIYTDGTDELTIEGNKFISDAGRGVVLNSSLKGNSVNYLSNNEIETKANSIELQGNGPDVTYYLIGNRCSSKVFFQKAEFVLKDNVLQSCIISRPQKNPRLYNNVMTVVDVTNASDSTRAISENNRFDEDYHNWPPIEYDDIIRGKRVTNKK